MKDSATPGTENLQWRCVCKTDKCPGRVYTLGDSTVGTPRPHCHPSNFTECEVKMIYAHAKELRVTSTAPPSQILTAVKRGASEAALLHLPKAESFKRSINRTKANGCYFHFCQAILRWVRENGLKKAYDAGTFDAATRTYTPSPV